MVRILSVSKKIADKEQCHERECDGNAADREDAVSLLLLDVAQSERFLKHLPHLPDRSSHP